MCRCTFLTKVFPAICFKLVQGTNSALVMRIPSYVQPPGLPGTGDFLNRWNFLQQEIWTMGTCEIQTVFVSGVIRRLPLPLSSFPLK